MSYLEPPHLRGATLPPWSHLRAACFAPCPLLLGIQPRVAAPRLTQSLLLDWATPSPPPVSLMRPRTIAAVWESLLESRHSRVMQVIFFFFASIFICWFLLTFMPESCNAFLRCSSIGTCHPRPSCAHQPGRHPYRPLGFREAADIKEAFTFRKKSTGMDDDADEGGSWFGTKGLTWGGCMRFFQRMLGTGGRRIK